MILTSSNTLVHKKIIDYKGLVTGESLIGANIYKDLFLAKNNERLLENAIFAVVLNFLFVLYNTNQ